MARDWILVRWFRVSFDSGKTQLKRNKMIIFSAHIPLASELTSFAAELGINWTTGLPTSFTEKTSLDGNVQLAVSCTNSTTCEFIIAALTNEFPWCVLPLIERYFSPAQICIRCERLHTLPATVPLLGETRLTLYMSELFVRRLPCYSHPAPLLGLADEIFVEESLDLHQILGPLLWTLKTGCVVRMRGHLPRVPKQLWLGRPDVEFQYPSTFSTPTANDLRALTPTELAHYLDTVPIFKLSFGLSGEDYTDVDTWLRMLKGKWRLAHSLLNDRVQRRLLFLFGHKYSEHIPLFQSELFGVAQIASNTSFGIRDGDHAVLSLVVSCLVVWEP